MNETGFIFNIQKFCIHDGPGIRTVVFFKGCPLRCRWCSNPESQSNDAEILWESRFCVHCLRCAAVCPVKAVSEGPLIDRRLCTGCGTCAVACPKGALTLSGKARALEEVIALCMQDLAFYQESGGGVTLSGGEALYQAPFAAGLLDALGERGVHRAIETAGFVPKEVFAGLISRTDLILFDVKHYDRERHREGTGVDSGIIFANLRTALDQGAEVLPRIPVIPGYNDGPEDARGFAALLKDFGFRRVQLLPFHQFGEGKYQSLQKPYALKGIPSLRREDLGEYQKVFAGA
ncbi:MAG: glycyl-radical enzyme activating protein, partial [Treponema sp.]|nr:glycyl-radical enzyme activating protein [Treponema sp.]